MYKPGDSDYGKVYINNSERILAEFCYVTAEGRHPAVQLQQTFKGAILIMNAMFQHSPCACDRQTAKIGQLRHLSMHPHHLLRSLPELPLACTYSTIHPSDKQCEAHKQLCQLSCSSAEDCTAGAMYLAKVPTLSPPFLLMKLG